MILTTAVVSVFRSTAMAGNEMTSDQSKSVVAVHGRLQAKGNRIVGKDNKPVSLAGMSLFWSQWISKYYTAETVAWLKKDWNATVIRAAIAVGSGGYLTNPEAEMARAKTVIDAAIKEGIYVIVDWHDHKAEDHPEQAVEFFTQIAKSYGKSPNLIYEIFNEPLQVSWKDKVKPYSERVIKAIRAIDPDNLIVVGNPTWSQDVDVAAADPIKDPNIAYTLHFYAGTHKQYLRDKAKKALDLGVALFVTEWGTVNANGDGAIDRESTEAWLAFMKENHLSHCNWSLADKVEGAAALKPGASPLGGWSDGDLTESGRYVRDIIRNWGR
jgi:aryl-phospho-beta-D-glucosidase BglC (GH1 family)